MTNQLTGHSSPGYQPSEVHSTSVAQLNQYVPNKNILSFSSVGQVQAQVPRPPDLQHMSVATSSPNAHEMYCTLFEYRDKIQQITLVLDSEATTDPLFCAFFGIGIDA
ncbi:hypothetical protein H4R33_001485 [Dimargaris cristalligena]|nr:hypothetical protein H4R33_001485 [Dimargaris cristalligena]